MLTLKAIRSLSLPLTVVAVLLVAVGAANPAVAQEVIGYSEILGTTNSTHIDTWSETDMDANTAYYYDAYVEGYLFQNDNVIVDGYAQNNPAAGGGFTEPLTVGDTYEIDSYHYLVQYFYSRDQYGNSYYSNPYNYLTENQGGGFDPSGSDFLNGGGPSYYENLEYIYLGATYVVLPTGVPNITSYNPTDGAVETSGTLTLGGTNLEDLFTQSTTPAITGTGMTLTIQSVTPTQVVLNYSIAENATPGAHNITLATRFGTSNPVNFNVGDPSPVVTSVSPSTWQAGTQFTVTISGRGFGTNPSINLLNATGVTISAATGGGDTQVQAVVTVAQNAPAQTVTVQVQSNGYYGNGFQGANPGQSPDGNGAANVEPVQPVPPQIMIGTDSAGSLCSSGTNVAGGAPVTVYTGQQISVTGCIPSWWLAGASTSWTPTTFPVTTAIATFNVGPFPTYTETLTQVQGTSCPSASYCDLTPFYWVAQGQQTLTFTYDFGNGTAPASATVTFNVIGPNGYQTANGVTTKIGSIDNAVVQINNFVGTYMLLDGITANNGSTAGIQFQAVGTEPAGNLGTYNWVQLVFDSRQQLDPNFRGTCPGGPAPHTFDLDGGYPYGYLNNAQLGNVFQSPGGAPNDTATDAPAALLQATMAEVARSFSATMYLMWTPNADPNCTTGNACAIPVPLGSLNWNLNGDTINTLNKIYNQTTWGLSCYYPGYQGTKEQVTFSPGTAYPQWGAIIGPGGQVITCP